MSVSFVDGGNLNPPPPPKKSIDLPQVTDYLNYIHISGVSHQQEKSEDTKGVISSRKSKTDMQYNCQEKKYKRRTCNTMAKRKSTKDGHAIQWPREKVQKMDMQYNGQDKKNRQTTIYNTLHRNERSSNMNPNKIRG